MTSRTAFTPGEWGQLRHLIQRWPDLRALTVRQPWADLIMAGVKPVENRSWAVPSTLPQWQRCPGNSPPGEPPGRWLPGAGWLNPMWKDTACWECIPDGPFPFRLGIHAAKSEAKNVPSWLNDVTAALNPVLLTRWNQLGALLGTVEVTGCHHADECRIGLYDEGGRHDRDDYCSRWSEPDVYHWTLADPEPMTEPIPLRGRQGLWRLDAAVAA